MKRVRLTSEEERTLKLISLGVKEKNDTCLNSIRAKMAELPKKG